MSTPLPRLYHYESCDACRRAAKFLQSRRIAFTSVPIRQQPPTVPELQQMLTATGSLRRLFNTAGQDYRTLGMKDRLPDMTESEALTLLSSCGNLVKRPFLLLPDGTGTTGFDEAAWSALPGLESR